MLVDRMGGQWKHARPCRKRSCPALRRTNPREVIEAALAHVVRNRVEAAYARSDLFERRRRLMDDWAGYLAQGIGALHQVKTRQAPVQPA